MDSEIIEKYDLFNGKDISDSIMNEMVTIDELNKGKKYALFILSRRDYSKHEMIKKLQTRQLCDKSIYKIVTWLEEKKFIDDESFAYSWVQYRIENKLMGRFLLNRELTEKGIKQSIREKVINDAFENISEESLARKLVHQKVDYKDFEYSNKEFKKIYNLLIRRGFSSDIAREIFFELLNKEFH